jgi:hypothetical protein
MNFLQKLFETKQSKLDREELARLKEKEELQLTEATKELADKIAAKAERDLHPWADIEYVGKKIKVNDYNKLFLDDLKVKLGNLVDGLCEADIIKLYVERENIELEEPRLDVKHAGISEDGRIKMELDWNTAFIRHLADNGISAETEDEAIQLYLSMLTHHLGDDVTTDMLSRDDVDAAFHDLDAEAAAELEEAARQIEEKSEGIKKARKPRAKKNKGE